MAARYRMFELTRDRAHLEEAWRLLQDLQTSAPVEHRSAMLTDVPLHRRIVQAIEGESHHESPA